MVRTVKFLRFLSFLLFLGILTLVYAYLPVIVQLTEDFNQLTVHKEDFFYYVVALFLIINVFIVIMNRIVSPLIENRSGEMAVAWFTALAFVLNIYLTMLMGYVGVLNNQTHIPLDAYAYLNYIGPFLLMVWLAGFFYLTVNKKQTT
mgnify:CR=1 FL=1